MDNNLKLNIYRFATQIDIGTANMNITGDESGLKKATKEASKDLETLDKSLTKTSTNLSNFGKTPVWSNKQLSSVRAGIKRYKQELKEMRKLAESPFASPKFKLEQRTAQLKSQTSGLGAVKLKDASSLNQSAVNKLLSQGESIGKKNITEAAKQEKVMAEYTKMAIDQLESQYNEFTKQKSAISLFRGAMDKATSSTSKMTEAFKNSMLKLRSAAVTWRILYGVFRQIWNSLSATVEKAASYQEALNLYRVAMGEWIEEADAWSEKISTALFLDPKQVMQYTGAFYNLVQGLGVGSEAAYKMSTNLTQLAYDMSSYLNIDVEAAHDKIQSAITGQARAVASAGIAMQQASLQELAYQLGIQKSVSEMTQAEKTYLRYIQILRSTTNMQGDLARTIVTPENALRVIKQQFELLGRAIGNVFIPIIMKAIPYVMAFTKALTLLANKLASMLGFKLAKIDYSSLTTADTAIEDTFDNIGTSAAKGAKSVGDSINRTLAAFDELNVVESESKGGSGGGVGGVGGGGGILPDLEKYIDGYDMLEGLNTELAKQAEKAYENLKKLWGVVKTVGAAFLVWKGLKLANTVLGWVDSFKKMYKAGEGIPGLFANFAKGWKDVGEGGTILEKLIAGFRNMLGPIGKFVVSIGTIVGAFASGYSIFSKWDMTLEDFGSRALKTTGIVTGLATAAFLLVSPWAAAGVAVAGVTGAIIGVIKARKEYEAELEKQAAYDKLFDGMGISIKTITDSFKDSATNVLAYYKELGNAQTELDKTSAELKNAQTSMIDLHNAIQAGITDDTTFNKLTASVETFKTKLNESRDANIAYNKTVIDNLLKEGQINKTEYDKMLTNISNYYSRQALYQSRYSDELLKLDTQLKNGQITQEKYNEEVGKLEQKYSGVLSAMELQGSTLEALYSTYGRKIDFKNENEVKQLYEDLTKIYEAGKDEIEAQRTKANDYFDEQIKHNQYLITSLEQRKDTWNDIDRQMYDDAKKALETFKKEQRLSNEGYKKDLEGLSAQYGNYLATMNAQLVESGAHAVDEMEGTYEAIKDKLLEITEDTDIRNAPNDLFGNWEAQFLKNGKQLGERTKKIFGDVGIEADAALFYNMKYGLDDGYAELQKDLEKHNGAIEYFWGSAGQDAASKYNQNMIDGIIKNIPEVKSYSEKAGKEVSSSMQEGLISGYNSKEVNKYYENKMGEIEVTCKDKLDIHSPSGVFKEIGKNMMLGLISGIEENSGVIQSKLSTVVSNMKSQVANNQIDFNFNTNVETSFNKILNKLQSFSNKWRNGINDTLSKTAKAFGSIVLNAMNKLTYSAMGYITIPTFAQGGYPTSGDLFMANENGRAEYITSIGNQTAVANQDQMITAITNAILQGMAGANTSQPNNIIVQIGNEKVYEGHGKYQNRQADRYGTTYVKI